MSLKDQNRTITPKSAGTSKKAPMMQLFVQCTLTGQTHVCKAPSNTPVESFLTAALEKSNLDPRTRAIFTLNSSGRIIEGNNCLHSNGLSSMDTLTISAGQSLVGGSSIPLLEMSGESRVHVQENETSPRVAQVYSAQLDNEDDGEGGDFCKDADEAIEKILPQLLEQMNATIGSANMGGASYTAEGRIFGKIWPGLSRQIDDQIEEWDRRLEEMVERLCDIYAEADGRVSECSIITAINCGFKLMPFSQASKLSAQEQAAAIFAFAETVQSQLFDGLPSQRSSIHTARSITHMATLSSKKIQKRELQAFIRDAFDPEQLETDDKLRQGFPLLDLQQTFWLVVALEPSKIQDKMELASLAQQQLVLMIRSARHTDLVKLISEALEKADSPKTLASFDVQLRQRAKKLSQLLLKKSCPDQNAHLWQLLPTQQLLTLAFSADQAVNLDLLRNCEPDQINELLKLMTPEQREAVAKAKFKILFQLKEKSMEQSIEQLAQVDDEERKVLDLSPLLPVTKMDYCLRIGLDGEQIVQHLPFKASVPCHELKADGKWSEAIDRTRQIRIYNVSEDRKSWNIKSVTNLSTRGDNCKGILPVRPENKDVAMLIQDKETRIISLHMIRCSDDQEAKIKVTEISETSQLQQDFNVYDKFSSQQFFRDQNQRLLIVYESLYTSEYGRCTNFYDVELDRVIIRLRHGDKYTSSLLCMLPGTSQGCQLCFFGFQNFELDLDAAREQPEMVETCIESLKKVQEHSDSRVGFCRVDWRKNGLIGFTNFNMRVMKLTIFEVTKENEVVMLKNFDLPVDRDWDLLLQEWVTDQSLPDFNDHNTLQNVVNEQIETSHHMAVMNKVNQSSIFVTHLNQDRKLSMVGFTFSAQIITFGLNVKAFNQDADGSMDPTIQVITQNRVYDVDRLITLKIQEHGQDWSWSQTQSFDLTLDKKALRGIRDQKIQLKFMKVRVKSKYLLNFVKTDKKILYICGNDYIEQIFQNSEKFKLREVEMLHFGRFLCVVHDVTFNQDCIHMIALDGKPITNKAIFTLQRTQVLAWHLRHRTAYILDSDYNLISIGLVWNDAETRISVESIATRSLQHFEALKEIHQLQGVPQHQLMLSPNTLAINDKLISLNSGAILRKKGTISVQSNSMLCRPDTRQEDLIQVTTNPNSRELCIGDESFRRSIREYHQLSPTLLLLKFGQSHAQLGFQKWILITTDGVLLNLPRELENALKQEYEVQSYGTTVATLQLLLTQRALEDKRAAIVQAKLITFTKSGTIASHQQLQVNQVEDHKSVAYESILRNQRGAWLQLRVTKFGKRVSQPVVVRNKVDLICFESTTEQTQFAYAGKFICWIEEQNLHLLDLETNESKQMSFSKLILPSQKPDLYHIDACDPRSLIEAGLLDEKIDIFSIQRLLNTVQVTAGTQAFIFKLNSEETPVLVAELDNMDKLYSPQDYIETGFKLFKATHTIRTGMLCSKLVFKSLIPTPWMNLVVESIGDDDIRIFRRFTSSNLHQAMSQKFETGLLWASFNHKSYLSLIKNQPMSMKAVYDHLVKQDYGAEELKGIAQVHPQLRRIAYMMHMQTIYFDKQRDQLRTNTLLTDLIKYPSHRDTLLKIGDMSPDFSLMQTFFNQGSYADATEKITPQLIEALSTSFTQTARMRATTLLEWPQDLEVFSYMSETPDIPNKEELEQMLKVESSEETIGRTVIVEKLDLSWLYEQGNSFSDFVSKLNQMPASLYTSKFTVSLLEMFWDDIQKKIIYRFFLPFVSLYVLAVVYFQMILQPGAEASIVSKILGACILILIGDQIYLELQQVIGNEKKLDYFLDFWNWLDITTILFTLLITILTLGEWYWIPVTSLRIMASLASFLLTMKFYDWLRLFEVTAFFILLIEQTFKDIKWFLILLLVALVAFGLPMIFLDMNREEESHLISPSYGFWVLDFIVNQYELSLGEFTSLENINGKPQADLAMTFFILATFFTQLTMLNMLIAIMGDSFAFATENKEKFATQMKIEILVTLAMTQTKQLQNEKKVNMIVVKPVMDAENDEGDWTGSINKVVNQTQKSMDTLKSDIKKAMGKMQSEIISAQKSNSSEVFAMKTKIQEGQEKMNTKIEAGQIEMKVQIASSRAHFDSKMDNLETMVKQLLANNNN